MIRLLGTKTVASRLCKALVMNPHVLFAEVASDSASKPIAALIRSQSQSQSTRRELGKQQ